MIAETLTRRIPRREMKRGVGVIRAGGRERKLRHWSAEEKDVFGVTSREDPRFQS